MKKTIFTYGLLLAALLALLKFLEYRFLMSNHRMEMYAGLLALFFTVLGIWMGMKWRQPAATLEMASTENGSEPEIPAELSKREFEVLQLIAQGHTNQQIADQLFVSIHTVKTHSSNLYSKLEVKNRTQAIKKAQEQGIV